MSLFFEWDPAKAAQNARQHGVTFFEAQTVFGDPFARVFDDPLHSSTSEARMLMLGESDKRRIIVVAFIERAEDRSRRISARKATCKERNRYEEDT